MMISSDGVVHVKISEFRVARAPSILKISGLGSCVALVLYDPASRLAGLAHILLPGPAPDKDTEPKPSAGRNLFKYADQAIGALVEALRREGVSPERLEAKITGGSKMFEGTGELEKSPQSKPGIGERNVEAIKNHLDKLSIPVRGEELGGNEGRTVMFDTASGEVTIINSRGDKKVL
jgi:chemotaxis protein CheD